MSNSSDQNTSIQIPKFPSIYDTSGYDNDCEQTLRNLGQGADTSAPPAEYVAECRQAKNRAYNHLRQLENNWVSEVSKIIFKDGNKKMPYNVFSKHSDQISILLETKDGSEWLNTKDGSEWLNTEDGSIWLRSKYGSKWVNSAGGKEWQKSDDGKEWLNSADGKKWLASYVGSEWLNSDDGNNWLKTEDGKKWQKSDDGKDWLSSVYGKDWLSSVYGKEWLNSADGKEWLNSEGGKKWLKREDGKKWLSSEDGKKWLMETVDNLYENEENRKTAYNAINQDSNKKKWLIDLTGIRPWTAQRNAIAIKNQISLTEYGQSYPQKTQGGKRRTRKTNKSKKHSMKKSRKHSVKKSRKNHHKSTKRTRR